MRIAVLDCKHCGRNIVTKHTSWYYILDTPLRSCPHCGKEYLYPYTIEWSIGGPLWQLFYTFLANGRWAFPVIACALWSFLSWKAAVGCILLWLIVSPLRLYLFDRKHIKASYERTKDNPAYIQKLSDLGYVMMDVRLEPYDK